MFCVTFCLASVQVAVLYMTTRLFVNLSQVYLPLWLQDNLQLGATSVATTPLALFVSGFLTSLVMGPLTQIVGRKVCCCSSQCLPLDGIPFHSRAVSFSPYSPITWNLFVFVILKEIIFCNFINLKC